MEALVIICLSLGAVALTLDFVNRHLLTVPPYSLSLCERSLAIGGPKVWNELSAEIKGAGSLPIFKRRLKTYIFKDVYDFLDLQNPSHQLIFLFLGHLLLHVLFSVHLLGYIVSFHLFCIVH